MTRMSKLLTIKEASRSASQFLNQEITASNISYLIQYGRIKKHQNGGSILVDEDDLIGYYERFRLQKSGYWKKRLGQDLNWALSFDHLREKETTKHVHRFHPYKGKFIPQLVEYFLDHHVDGFKKEASFKKGDIVLDPFCGSGTTVVQANELGIDAIGVDISIFNTLISNAKVQRVNFEDLKEEFKKVTDSILGWVLSDQNRGFERELFDRLNEFNREYFPGPDYKIQVRQKKIDEKKYSRVKEKEFVDIFNELKTKYSIRINSDCANTFLEKWYIEPIRKEMDLICEKLDGIQNSVTRRMMRVILSRTVRSCRATTHSDLATLKEPVTEPYYCRKHGKICKPLFSLFSWWRRYSQDTLSRLYEFDGLRTDSFQIGLQGDSRNIDLLSRLQESDSEFAEKVKKQKIKGIFSSPPYVGLIDYHEQHAYSYELFGFERHDHLEIGPLFKGRGEDARRSYIQGIVRVLKHSKLYLQRDYDIFLVANDRYNIFPMIAKKAGMRIVNRYKRPVLNRTEKNRSAYAEMIFHLKEK